MCPRVQHFISRRSSLPLSYKEGIKRTENNCRSAQNRFHSIIGKSKQTATDGLPLEYSDVQRLEFAPTSSRVVRTENDVIPFAPSLSD